MTKLDLTKNLTPKRMKDQGIEERAARFTLRDGDLVVDLCDSYGVMHMFNAMRHEWLAKGYSVTLSYIDLEG